jgi:hypothetical protein
MNGCGFTSTSKCATALSLFLLLHKITVNMMFLRALLLLFAFSTTGTSAFCVHQKPCGGRNPFSSLLAASFDEYQANGGETSVAIKDLVMGTGDEVQDGNVLTVAYKGTVLQTSENFGQGTFRFKYGEKKVMQGWNDAVEGMRLGGSRIAKIPPSLAFGDKGQANIPPHADLQVDIELQQVQQGILAEIAMELGLKKDVRTFGIFFFLILFFIAPVLPIS